MPAGNVNVTDPDSRSIPIGFGFVQGYNAQAAVNEHQIVLAAEITNNSTDFSQLEAVAADAGYWNEQHIDEVVANKHIPVLIPPDKGSRGTPLPGWTGGRYAWMRAVLATEHGRRLYRKRAQTVEPLFGNTKHNNGVYRFHRRGRVKVRTEWRLLMMTPQPRQAPPPPAHRRGGLNRPLRRRHRRSPQPVTAIGCHPRPRARAPQRSVRQPPSKSGMAWDALGAPA